MVRLAGDVRKFDESHRGSAPIIAQRPDSLVRDGQGADISDIPCARLVPRRMQIRRCASNGPGINALRGTVDNGVPEKAAISVVASPCLLPSLNG